MLIRPYDVTLIYAAYAKCRKIQMACFFKGSRFVLTAEAEGLIVLLLAYLASLVPTNCLQLTILHFLHVNTKIYIGRGQIYRYIT